MTCAAVLSIFACLSLCRQALSSPQTCDTGLGLIQRSPLLKRIEAEYEKQAESETGATETWTPVDGGVNRACRGASSSDNSDTYFTVQSAADLPGCKGLCEQTSGCQGIEYHTSGRCEVWTRPNGIGASIVLVGYTCLRYGSDEFMDVDGGKDRACRGASETDNDPSHYTVSDGSMEECKRACQDNLACVGIEYAGTRCEIWTRPDGILSSSFSAGSTCQRLEFTYVDGSSDRACRGDSIHDNSPSYFSVFTASIAGCKEKCRKTSGCVGIEVIGTRCEVWTRAEGIKVGREATGYSCLRYHGGLHPAPSTKQEQDARFLIQATFGPTLQELKDLGQTTYVDWINRQIALPPSSLRVYYRQRANPSPRGVASSMATGRPASRCAAGSRWVNHAILMSDQNRKIKVSNNKIYVDGFFRSDIDPLFIGNGLPQPKSCSNVPPPGGDGCTRWVDMAARECTKDAVWVEDQYCARACFMLGLGYEEDDCSPGWPSFAYEGFICTVQKDETKALIKLGTSSSCKKPFTAMLNPAVWISDPDSSTMQPLLFDVFRPGVLLLKEPPLQCNLGTVVQSDIESTGQFYMLEERLELLENTLENPAATGAQGGKCPTVPKTFLNENHCKLLPGCLALGEQGLSVSLTVDTLTKFFTVGGRYVYVVSGLRPTTSPCGKVSRWKQLACGSECAVSALSNATIERLQSVIEEAADQGTVRDVDFACSGVEAESIVQVGNHFFQHVHIEEDNVYDFTDWTLQHPGGAAKIKQFTGKGYNIIFPSWHPMDRWDLGIAPDVIGAGYVGKMGATVSFNSLPQPLQTDSIAEALGALVTDQDLSEVCGSPGEVANQPSLGHRLSFYHGGRSDIWFDSDYGFRTDRDRRTKDSVWTMQALFADDQLRQRMAWALSQIYVCSVEGGEYGEYAESWLNYFDIFVRNAFGNLRDVLREVTYNPIMGGYLTYKRNRAFDSIGRLPDENYAREVMQLFTIGLWKLNPDGSQMLDALGNPIPTYSNAAVMDFARVFTGFDEQRDRGNLEYVAGSNRIDPMQMKVDWHDKYPKPNLDGGYLGDGYPLCSDFEEKAFLKAGARYMFIGKSQDSSTDEALVLSNSSDLFKTLCFESGGSCKYNLTVELRSTVVCNGAECTAHTVQKVNVAGGLYKYLEPTCVNLFFFQGQVSREGGSGFSRSKTCRDPKALIAGTSCCNGCKNRAPTWKWLTKRDFACKNAETTWPAMLTEKCNLNATFRDRKYCQLTCWEAGLGYEGDNCSFGLWKAEQICNYPLERVSYQAAERTCQSRGMRVCAEKLEDYGCGFDSKHVWTQENCSYEVLVHPSGMVSSNLTSKTKQNTFSVSWKDGAYPSSESCPTGCQKFGDVCSCGIADVEVRPVFSQKPTISGLEKLKIGATPPTSACTDCDGNIRVYNKGEAIDEDTVFEHQGKFYSNKESVVVIAGGAFEFRNPPVFLPTNYAEPRHALAEMESLLDHLFQHPNTAPFISYRLIQRLVTSNPSQTYVRDVADAFRTGRYQGKTYSGTYGDLAATTAAILLHDEARFPRAASDGALREPLLKFIHVMRSLEYKEKDPDRMVMLNDLQKTIGQYPFSHGSVFSYYLPDFKPDNFPDGKVAPEFEIFTPAKIINFVNGISSLIDHGLGDCNGGFGHQGPSSSTCSYGEPQVGPLECVQPTLDQLDLLLTGGRIHNKTIFRAAYDEAARSNRYKVAQKAVILSPEFHTMGHPFPMGLRAPSPPKPVKEPRDYKAVVMIFLAGGADTFNMLVPLNCPLYDEYRTRRSRVALDGATLHQISAQGQPCSEFGLHPELPVFKELYDSNELAFAANVGSLVKPLDKASYKDRSVERCVGLFSHSDQQRAAQTLTCQFPSPSFKGAGGRLADALAEGSSKLQTMSFSLKGSAPWPSGFDTNAQIITDGEPIKVHNDFELEQIINNITSIKHGNIYAEEYNQRFSAALDHFAKLRKTLRAAKLKTGFATDNWDLTKQLKQIARLISARGERKIERDLFFVKLGGWDHHDSLARRLNSKFRGLNHAFQRFVTELKAQNMFESVVMVTHSDFGRTLGPNSGDGTDHGWAGNYVIAGGGINGGKIFNSYPRSLLLGGEQDSGQGGRLFPKFPFESFMVPIAQWMGVEAEQLQQVFPNIGNFNSSTLIDHANLFK